MIIALGESIVAIGAGVAHLPISWPIIGASVAGARAGGGLWWAYFDVVAIVAERVLRRAQGEVRARLARDAYSYLHLPMIAGIVLVALGLKKVLRVRRRRERRRLSPIPPDVPLVAMYGGVALYLFAHVAFKYRTWRQVTVRRLAVAVLLCALIRLAKELPALVALGLVTASSW